MSNYNYNNSDESIIPNILKEVVEGSQYIRDERPMRDVWVHPNEVCLADAQYVYIECPSWYENNGTPTTYEGEDYRFSHREYLNKV